MGDYYGSGHLDYGTSMDRYASPVDSEGNPNMSVPWADGVDIATIGISTPPMKDQLQSLKARIFQGARKVELGFWGKGKGSKGQGGTTPEQVDTWQRRDIKELAEFNKVQLTTHVTPAIGNLSGLTDKGFLDEEREKAMHEIQRTIDFAADTTQGGAVVVHLGEFPRAFSEQEDWGKGKGGEPKFLMYPTESEHAKQYVVDERTGQFMGTISKDQVVFEPKWTTAKDWEEEMAQRGNHTKIVGALDKDGRKIEPTDWVDIDGNVISKDAQPEELFNRRVPKWDKEGTKFETERRTWDWFKTKADEWNSEHKDNKKTPAMIFYETQIDNQILQAKGSSLFYAHQYDDLRENITRAKKAFDEYKQLEDNMDPDKRWKIAVERYFAGGVAGSLIPRESEMPTAALDRFIDETKKNMRYMHESSATADARAAELMDMKTRLKPLETFAKTKTADTIARAAEYAMAKSAKTKDPLFVSPENIFPEMYGSHPEELREIIQLSRDAFAKHLVEMKQVGNMEAANKLAERHIKATFDIGHAYTWRKYFKGTDEEFNKWLMTEIDALNKAKVIGHVHVSDNFGYEDEHVTPGRGKVPVQEFIAKMKAAGITDIVVEPSDQDYEAMIGAWGIIGKPIYGVAGGGVGWTDIERSYFGRVAPPYFLYGDSAPSPQDWSLWSGVKLE